MSGRHKDEPVALYGSEMEFVGESSKKVSQGVAAVVSLSVMP